MSTHLPNASPYEQVASDRDGVTRVLTDGKVKAVIRRRNIQLIGYDDGKNQK